MSQCYDGVSHTPTWGYKDEHMKLCPQLANDELLEVDLRSQMNNGQCAFTHVTSRRMWHCDSGNAMLHERGQSSV